MEIKYMELHSIDTLRALYSEIANLLYEENMDGNSVLRSLNPSKSDIWVAACVASTVLIEQAKYGFDKNK